MDTRSRWLENDFAYDGDYICYEYNLAYRHKKLFKTAGVA